MTHPAPGTPSLEPLDRADPREVGGYSIVARLGAGGMGRVFLAGTRDGRRLAVKVIRPELADDGEFRRRFQREIAAAQRVHSAYTAPVVDADPGGARPWLATAYIPGPSLAQAVTGSGPLPPRSVRFLVAAIAEALRDIHAAGVIHRDLKPSNVVLAPDGPRVIDFGVARAADATPLTRTGVGVGSPQFMAPEQALGQACTPAADVFALGALAFFAATGRSAFGDGPDAAVLFRIAHHDPDLEGCPDQLRPLITRCLAKDPQHRPRPAELMAELRPDPGPLPTDWLPTPVMAQVGAYQALPAPSTVPALIRRTDRSRTLLLVGAGAGALAMLLLVGVVLAVVPDGSPPASRSGNLGGAQAPPSTSPTPAGSAQGTPSPRPAQAVYLTDLEPVNESHDLVGTYESWVDGAVTVDGHTYDRAITVGVGCREQVREYALSRGYGRLRATVGLADDTPHPTPATIKVVGDGKTIRSESVRLGHPLTLDVDVRGLVRLGLNAAINGECYRLNTKVALGDPLLQP